MEPLRDRLLAYMREHVTMTLATSGGGQPWAATLFYANDGFDIYYLSALSSQHSVNVLANPTVAVTISQDYADWQEIRGIQLRGRAALLDDEASARDAYLAKFPFVATFQPTDARYWIVRCEWIRLVDTTIAFAYKEEMDLKGNPV
ncbi:MAG: pyridoxamine 5'-phosphate oxidase family protein [Chloroflexota bacterium]|nr:pyridoxamine 5'-phosphate oxidase family protein [Chloroflexota bacterium]